MADLNDFKLIKQISKKYFNNFSNNISLSKEIEDLDRERFGFYFFILENITGNKDLIELKDNIIDTYFNNKIFEIANDDLGIDAVYIDEDSKKIMLFNFKYREKFKDDNQQDLNSMSISGKFLEAIMTENLNNLNSLSKKWVEEIIKKYKSDDIFETTLYIISNEYKPITNVANDTIKNFENMYGLEIKSIILDDIIKYVNAKPKDISAKFIVDKNSIMSYEKNEYSSSRSYLVKLSLATLVRITCSCDELRQEFNLGDFNKLKDQELFLGLLYDNIRGYLGNTKFNDNIVKTLVDNPENFFFYNNGITVISKNIDTSDVNGNKKVEFTVKGFQIVNGGQTLRSIYKFLESDFDEEKLSSANILVRFFQTKDENLTNNIAEFTNSQNSINQSDLKSISNLQIQIEAYLKEHNIRYIRKIGDIGNSDNSLSKSIAKETLAQILYSKMGYPYRATNQKNALFGKYYDEIFDNINVDDIVKYVEEYFNIIDEYQKFNYDKTNQKYFYIAWLNTENSNSIQENIELLERALQEYKNNEQISPARKLIQKGFKDYLLSKLKCVNEQII